MYSIHIWHSKNVGQEVLFNWDWQRSMGNDKGLGATNVPGPLFKLGALLRQLAIGQWKCQTPAFTDKSIASHSQQPYRIRYSNCLFTGRSAPSFIILWQDSNTSSSKAIHFQSQQLPFHRAALSLLQILIIMEWGWGIFSRSEYNCLIFYLYGKWRCLYTWWQGKRLIKGLTSFWKRKDDFKA